MNGNVECDLDTSPYTHTEDNWVFQIKDCQHYAPAQPQQPTGKDTLCVNTNSITTYTTTNAVNAWYYEWVLLPEDAGTITPSFAKAAAGEKDSITTQIYWSQTYEGTATLKVRSTNDCGVSAWSDSLEVETYMCLGSEENVDNKHGISVYPNPAKTKLFVKCNKLNAGSTATVEVFDRFGRLSSTFQVRKDLTGCIDVANLSKGLYFVRVVVDGKIIGVRKVVIE